MAISITTEQALALHPKLQQLALQGVKSMTIAQIMDLAQKIYDIGAAAAVANRTRILTYRKHGTVNPDGSVLCTALQQAEAEDELVPMMATVVTVSGAKLPHAMFDSAGMNAADIAPLMPIVEPAA